MLAMVFALGSIFLLVFMLTKKINAHMALLLSGLYCFLWLLYLIYTLT